MQAQVPLLPERCEEWREQLQQADTTAVTSSSAQHRASRETERWLRHGEQRHYRLDEDRAYRHWGINE